MYYLKLLSYLVDVEMTGDVGVGTGGRNLWMRRKRLEYKTTRDTRGGTAAPGSLKRRQIQRMTRQSQQSEPHKSFHFEIVGLSKRSYRN